MSRQPEAFTDLTGRAFERLDLTGADLRRVRLAEARLRRIVMTDGEIRGSYLGRTRLVGVDLEDVEITGAIENLTINGVDVSGYVAAELDRRDPERTKMRPRTPEEFREAWSILERRWAETVARARDLDPELLHVQVDEEWSFIQTLRHLAFATESWFLRAVRGEESPWHPLSLPWDEAPGWVGIPWDREARPSLEEALALRVDRFRSVGDYLATVTQDELDASTGLIEGSGWPPPGPHVVGDCLRVVVNEEWYHRQFAERDLDRVSAQA